MEDPEDSDKKKELKRIYLTGDYKIDYLNYDSSFNGVERYVKTIQCVILIMNYRCERPTLIPDLEYRLRTTSEPIEYSFSIPPTPTC